MYFKVNMISNCCQDDLNLSVMKNTHILKTVGFNVEYYSDIKLFRIGRRGSIFFITRWDRWSARPLWSPERWFQYIIFLWRTLLLNRWLNYVSSQVKWWVSIWQKTVSPSLYLYGCQIENLTNPKNKSVRWTGLSVWQHWQSPSKSVFLSIFCWSEQKGSYPPNRGRSCCLVACPPGSRTPARPPPEGSECCSPCLPHQVIHIPRPHQATPGHIPRPHQATSGHTRFYTEATPVCDAGWEVVDRRSLVGSGQTTLVVLQKEI